MQSILHNAENTRESMTRLHKEGAFNMEALVAELKKVGVEKYRDTTLYRSVPIVAAWQSASDVAKEMGFDFRTVRENPRNRDHAPTAEESRILQAVSGPGGDEFSKRTRPVAYWSTPSPSPSPSTATRARCCTSR
jgi:methyl-accepting chemotaxis protein